MKPLWPERAAMAVALAILVAACFAAPTAPWDAPYEGTWILARLLFGAAAVSFLIGRRLHATARPWLALGAAGAAGLALVAAYGQAATLHGAPFLAGHEHLIGLPSALPFVLLAAAPAVEDTAARRALTWTALLWGAAVLVAPTVHLGAVEIPLLALLERGTSGDPVAALRALSALACGVAVAVTAARLLRQTSRGGPAVDPPTRWLRLSTGWGLAALIAFHALAGVLSGRVLPGILLAGGLALTTHLLRAAPAAWLTLGESARERLARVGAAALIAVPLALFFVHKAATLGPSNSDENIYFYMAAAFADGALPYADYFFAHPPLHVVLPGLVFSAVGYSFTLAKLFPVVASMVTALAITLIARRQHRGWGGLVAGVIAAVLFLFATETLKASTNMTGVNLTTMWLALGLWQSLSGRGVWAGIFFGLAATTGFYSMAAVCALLSLAAFRWPEGASTWWRKTRFFRRQCVTFIAVAGGINLLFWTIGGEAYVDGVYRYHGMKALRDPQMVDLLGGAIAFPASLLHNIGVMVGGREFTRDLFYHAHLWIALPLVPVAAALIAAVGHSGTARLRALRDIVDPRAMWRTGATGTAVIVWLTALALFAQYAMFRELYSFYWVLIYPTLALSIAWLVVHAARLVTVPRTRPATAPWLRAAGAVAVLGALSLHTPWGAGLQSAFAGELEDLGARNDYTWRDAPALSALSPVARALFWADARHKGDHEPGTRHALWTKTRIFSQAEALAAYIAAHSTPDESIAGASTSAPLVALLANRRIAANEIDTNNKRFRTKLLAESDYWNAICADNVRFIVSAGRSYFSERRMSGDPTPRRWFRRVDVRFDDDVLSYHGATRFILYERVGDPPAPNTVCRWEAR